MDGGSSVVGETVPSRSFPALEAMTVHCIISLTMYQSTSAHVTWPLGWNLLLNLNDDGDRSSQISLPWRESVLPRRHSSGVEGGLKSEAKMSMPDAYPCLD